MAQPMLVAVEQLADIHSTLELQPKRYTYLRDHKSDAEQNLLTPEQEEEVKEMEKEVDQSLLDWMLCLTPLERLRVAERYAESAWNLHENPQNI